MILPPWLWRLTHSKTFWITLPGALVTLIVLFYGIANTVGTRKLGSVRNGLAQRGYSLTWADLLKANPPADSDLLQHEVIRRNPSRIEDRMKAMGYQSDNLELWTSDPKTGKRFSAAAICGKSGTDEQAAASRLLHDLGIMEPVASEIKMAVRTSNGIALTISGSPPRANELPPIFMDWMYRNFPRRALVRAAANDPNGAMDDLHVVFEYLQLNQKQPQSMIRNLVAMASTLALNNHAWQIIQQPCMSADQLQEIDRWLSELDHGKSCLSGYRFEMVAINEGHPLEFGSITAVPPESMKWKFDWKDRNQWSPTANRWWRQVRPVGLIKLELVATLDRIDKEIIHLPDGSERETWTVDDADRIAAIHAKVPYDYEDAKLQDRIYTAAEPMIRRHLKALSCLRLTRTAIAAELYRRDHGSFPNSTDPLVPRYLQQPLIDAQSDQPIQLEPAKSGGITLTTPGTDAKTKLNWPFPAK